MDNPGKFIFLGMWAGRPPRPWRGRKWEGCHAGKSRLDLKRQGTNFPGGVKI